MPSSSLIVGLDVGGSKTLLRGEWAERSARIEQRGPGANPNRVGEAQAAEVLTDVVEEALAEQPLPGHLFLSAGVSGAGDEAVQSALAEALRTRLARPDLPVDVEVVHDGLIALDAAYDEGSGVIIIAGTGSVVLARSRDGALLRAGGWGPLLGDDGSGYALGRAGLRAVAEAFDGGTDTALRPRVQEAFDLADRAALIRAVHSEALPLQDVAPMVVAAAREGDAPAQRVLHEEITALTRQVAWTLEQADDVAPRLTLLGGLTHNDHYRQVLRRRLRDQFPDWSVQRLETEPVTGALRRARRLAAAS